MAESTLIYYGDKIFSMKIKLIIILIIATVSGIGIHYYSLQMPEMPEFPVFERSQPLVLIFVGDIMLDRGVRYMVDRYGNGDYRFPFLKIKERLEEADILFGNLESMISDKGEDLGGVYSFRADPRAIEGLVWAGFNLVSVSNNHVFDYGREAMEDCFSRLKEAGIIYVGGGFNKEEAYSPVITEVKGVKVAFLAYTDVGSPNWAAREESFGIAWLDMEEMKKGIYRAKKEADIVIVSFHYGEEYQSSPNLSQIEVSQAAIEYGADLVIGHHPHVIQPIEGNIAYSLGNFVFDQGFSEETMEGLLLKAVVINKEIKELIPIKFRMNEYFQPIPID